VLQHEPASFSPDDMMRVLRAASAFGSDPIAKALMRHMDTALLATPKNDLSPHHIGAIALSYAEVGGPSDAEVMRKLAAAAMMLEPWVLEVDAMANIVKAYSTIEDWDAALFARMSTVLQQVDPAGFHLASIATIAQAYSHEEVRDKALLGKLSTVLQQMDSIVFSSSEAVQEVSMILNAYAKSQMKEVALMLSQTLTNHLKPHIGGVTAQAMLNIIRRGVRSQSRSSGYVGGVREALEISRLDDDELFDSYSRSRGGSLEESRLGDDDEQPELGTGLPLRNSAARFSPSSRLSDDELDLDGPPANGLGRALVPFSQEVKRDSSSSRKKLEKRAAPIPLGWS